MLSSIHRNNRISRVFRALMAVSALLLYLAGNLEVESIHQLSHAHESSLAHTDEQEHNPCHRSVYHQEQDEHQWHVTAFKKCLLCHNIPITDQLLITKKSERIYLSKPVFTNRFVSFWVENSLRHLPSRAPPAC